MACSLVSTFRRAAIFKVVTDLLDVQVSVSILVISIALIAYFFCSDRIVNWLVDRSRRSRLRAAKKLEDSLTEMEDLRGDSATLISRVAWDTLMFQASTAIWLILVMAAMFFGQSLPELLKQGFVPGIFFGFLFSLSSELRKLRYIRELSRFDEYRKKARARIVTLTQARLAIMSAKYGVDGNDIDVTEYLKQQVSQDSLTCRISNKIAGDPAPGAFKRCVVEYTFAGKEHTTVAREGDLLSLPANPLDTLS